MQALQGVDLSVRRGKVFSLLGPNGAGKTTLIRILTTLTTPDAGTAVVNGWDVGAHSAEVRGSIAVTGQFAAVDALQTGEENLTMIARLAGLRPTAARKRSAELIERFDLGEFAYRRTSTYSGGNRRRLDLAISLIRKPSILFLDEPTTGVDVRGRLILWDVVSELVQAGVSIFLTTQYLEEADRLADQLALIDQGRIVATGTPAELKARVGGSRLDLVAVDDAAFTQLKAALGSRIRGDWRCDLTLRVSTDGTAAGVRMVLDEVDPDRSAVARFSIASVTLDEVFLAMTTAASMNAARN